MKKRLLAMLLTLCMVLTLLPATALAVEEQPVGQTPVVCAQLDGCTAETHREGCPLYVVPADDPEPAAPTATETTPVPAEPVCECGAAANAEGAIVHESTCPLYQAPVVQMTPAESGARIDSAMSGSGTEQSPYLITEAEQIYALARILTKAPTSDTDAVLTEALKADYALFSVSSDYKDAYTVLQTAHYKLGGNITLTNKNTDETSNGFVGIPNFKGTFDGNKDSNYAITLTLNYAFTASSTVGLFNTVNGATIKSLKIAEGSTLAVTQTGGFNFYGGFLIGRSTGVTISDCEVNGDINIAFGNRFFHNLRASHIGFIQSGDNTITNCVTRGKLVCTGKSDSEAVGILHGAGIVHANGAPILAISNCDSYVDIAVDYGYTNGICGLDNVTDAANITITNCNSHGELKASNGTAFAIAADRLTAITNCSRYVAAADGEYILHPSGQTLTAANGTLAIPVSGSKGELAQNNYCKDSIYLSKGNQDFDFGIQETFYKTLKEKTNDPSSRNPFTEGTPLELNTQEKYLQLRNAINQGNQEALTALFSGTTADAADAIRQRRLLSKAYIKVTGDFTITSTMPIGIGTATYPFAGSLDGGGHTVELKVSVQDANCYASGFLGVLSSETPQTIKNLKLAGKIEYIEKTQYNMSYDAAGSLLLRANENYTISGCDSAVAISHSTNGATAKAKGGILYLGGLFGSVSGAITDCEFTGSIKITETGHYMSHLGGIASQSNGIMANCKNSGAITANITEAQNIDSRPYIGGIVSLADNTITNCTNTGTLASTIATKYSFLGGIAAATNKNGTLTLENCLNSGSINGVESNHNANVGGLIGYLTPSTVNIIDCSNAGTIVGYRIGGLVGATDASSLSIKDSCNYGALTGTTLGGLIGLNSTHPNTTFQNAVYLKTAAVTKACGNITTDATGVIALDTTALPGTTPTFGGTVDLLTAAPPTQLTFAPADSVSMDGTGKLTFTKAGYVVVSAKWNGTEIYESANITVARKDISASAAISGVLSAYPHTGSAITPVPTVKLGDTVLTLGTDYDVTYDKNINAGTEATITVNFKGNYSGTATKTFEISTTALAVTSADYNGVYDGQEHKITVTAPEGATISYCTTVGGTYGAHPALKDAATTTVYFKVEKANCTTVTGSQVVTITPKPLTVTAKSYSIYVGGTAPKTYEYIVTGLASGEDLLTAPTTACAPDVSKVGSYPITITGATVAVPDNYTITHVPGTLTVSNYSSGGSSSDSTDSVSGSGDSVSVGVYGGSVTSAQMERAVGRADEGATIDIKAVGSTDATLPLSGLSAAADNGNTLAVTTQNGEIALSAEALKGLAEGAVSGAKATVGISAASAADAGVPTGTPVFDVSVSVGGQAVHSFDGALDITLTVSNLSKIENPYVLHVLNDGTKQYLKPTVSGNQLTVSGVTNLSYFAVIPGSAVPEKLPFTDVSQRDYFYDAVLWAVGKDITGGTSATTFSPNWVCTRAQAVTFLWRAAGSPATTGNNPFTDVDSGAYYYDAVLWAMEKGITSGTSATTFAPNTTCTRGQIATFLYRYAGSPTVLTGNPFTDVTADDYCANAVAWAAAENITSGTSATIFAPGADCTRGQIITFLYRHMGK